MHAEYGGHYQYKPFSPSNTQYNYTPAKTGSGNGQILTVTMVTLYFTVGGVSVITVQKTVGEVNYTI